MASLSSANPFCICGPAPPRIAFHAVSGPYSNTGAKNRSAPPAMSSENGAHTSSSSTSPASAALTYTTLGSATAGALAFTTPDGATLTARPRLVVNAAGPWIDGVNAALGAPSRMIGGTKGSHILLDHPELVAMLAGRMIYFEADDGRICLVFDYLGRALVGSTDTPADTDLYGTTNYVRTTPACPSGGTYTIDDMSTRPSCDIGTNGTGASDDHTLP